jgi:FAD/FMN-containing dehydrogenase
VGGSSTSTTAISEGISQAGVDELGAEFAGPLLLPTDPGYDEARDVWNGSLDRKPALIARCTGVQDVAAAVRFARRHDLLTAVRGGGHSIPGHSVCEGGLMIDLSPMKGMRIDVEARTAQAQPGLKWGEFDRETGAYGLAVPGGYVSTTGIAGLTLGGGIGWISRKHGLTCDNLIGADVVTADGELVRADAERNADLFWGLRGGGGNFGIVTNFEYRLHEVPSVLGGALIYRGGRAPEVLPAFRDFALAAPRELTCLVLMVNAPTTGPTRRTCRATRCSSSASATPGRARSGSGRSTSCGPSPRPTSTSRGRCPTRRSKPCSTTTAGARRGTRKLPTPAR